MGLSEKLVEIKSEADALIQYANETTSAGDETLGDCIQTLIDGYGGGEGMEWEYIGESTNENVLTFTHGKYKAFYCAFYNNNSTTGSNVYIYTRIDGHIYNRWTSATGTNKSIAGFGFYLPYMSFVYVAGKTSDYTGYLSSTSRGAPQAHLADNDTGSVGKAMMGCSTPDNVVNWSMKVYGLK